MGVTTPSPSLSGTRSRCLHDQDSETRRNRREPACGYAHRHTGKTSVCLALCWLAPRSPSRWTNQMFVRRLNRLTDADMARLKSRRKIKNNKLYHRRSFFRRWAILMFFGCRTDSLPKNRLAAARFFVCSENLTFFRGQLA